jgi:hypothetical protein
MTALPWDEAKTAAAELKRIESEIDRALAAIERSGAGAGSLVDAEGFPRADVDVHTARWVNHCTVMMIARGCMAS